MDLRPLNPYYYRARSVARFRLFSLTATEEYSYPYLWEEPVTDRTQADVEYLKQLRALGLENMTEWQQAEYADGLKGALNWTDLLRVENNIQILLDVLEIERQSNLENLPEMPTDTYFEEMLANVAAIREAYCIHQTTPEVPKMPLNTWQKWNDIEQILKDVHEILCNNFHYYCGEGLYINGETALLL